MEGIQLSLVSLLAHNLNLDRFLLILNNPNNEDSLHTNGTTSSNGTSSNDQEDSQTRSSQSSTDVLVPPFDSDKRKLNSIPAALALAATLTGPGLLVIPQIFATAGVLQATLLLTAMAAITDRTLYLTCVCARRGGVATVADVGNVAFGSVFGMGVAAAMTILSFFLLIVELTLVQQALGPPVQVLRSSSNISNGGVLGVVLLVLLPFLSFRELLSLRKSYYAWCVAVVFTLGTLLYSLDLHQINSKMEQQQSLETSVIIAKNIANTNPIAASLPYAIMAFSCGILNILPIQGALREPTCARIQSVIRAGVVLSFIIAYTFGIAGSLYADGRLQTNFLLNITSALSNNGAAFLAACSYGLMLFLSIPLTVQPCRRLLLEAIDKIWLERDPHACHGCREHCPQACEECCDEDPDEQTCITLPSLSSWSVSAGSDNALLVHTTTNEGSRLLPAIAEEEIRRCNIQNNLLLHGITTVVLLLVGFILVTFFVTNDGVMTAWRVAGSTAAPWIAYALPAACFVLIQERDPTMTQRQKTVWTLFSWLLLIATVAASVVGIATALATPI